MYKDTFVGLMLVVDCDPTARTLVRQAAEHLGWRVLEAVDSLTGIEFFRRYERAIDLVVLDLSLPDLDGYDMCLRLRALSDHRHTPLPILPCATTTEADSFLASLGCAPTLLKPASIDQIQQSLQRASAHLGRPTLPSAILGYAYRKANITEQVVRQDRGFQPRAILYVPACGLRVGLSHVLRTSGVHVVTETGSIQAVTSALKLMGNHILVSDAEGYPLASCVAEQTNTSLLVLAVSEQQRQMLMHDDMVLNVADSILDISTDAALAKLPQAFAAIQSGKRLICLKSSGTNEVTLGLTVPPYIAAYFLNNRLTKRWLELLWLDYHGKSTSEVARQFIVSEATIQSYWKRLQRKMQRSRSEVRTWFRHKLLEIQVQG